MKSRIPAQLAVLLAITVASSVSNAAILVNFSGGSTSGTAVAHTNNLTSTGIAAGSVVDLDGNAVTGLAIGVTSSEGVHVNGAAAVLTTTTIAKSPAIDAVFGAYQHAASSSWGPINAGVANTYTVSLSGLAASQQYRVQILHGRDGGIGLPSASSSSISSTGGTITMNLPGSVFHLYDNAPTPGNSILNPSESSGVYTFNYSLALNDVGMTTWDFTVNDPSAVVNLSFINPINSMLITAIPEPSAALLGAFGLLALIRRRR